jgi:hypothetical protein
LRIRESVMFMVFSRNRPYCFHDDGKLR